MTVASPLSILLQTCMKPISYIYWNSPLNLWTWHVLPHWLKHCQHLLLIYEVEYWLTILTFKTLSQLFFLNFPNTWHRHDPNSHLIGFHPLWCTHHHHFYLQVFGSILLSPLLNDTVIFLEKSHVFIKEKFKSYLLYEIWIWLSYQWSFSFSLISQSRQCLYYSKLEDYLEGERLGASIPVRGQ